MPERFLGEKYDSFEEAFPDIEGLTSGLRKRTSLKPSVRTITAMKIPHPVARYGFEQPMFQRRFYLGLLVSEMVRKKETELDTREVCKGAEKIGDNSRTCVHGFNVETEIEYVD